MWGTDRFGSDLKLYVHVMHIWSMCKQQPQSLHHQLEFNKKNAKNSMNKSENPAVIGGGYYPALMEYDET